MPKYLTKLSKFGGQFRLTIPKPLVQELKWQDVEFVILSRTCDDGIRLGRFVDGESLKVDGQTDPPGSD